ncbi:FecR domain-containing protein [Parvularcula marina]|uniref:FecR family protein n=1 Tax=Parvularcula marina TaxID=2292771 RepID=UPI003511B7B0
MRGLLFLLIMALLGATGFYAYKYFSEPQTYPDGSIGRVEREQTQSEICATEDGDCSVAAVEDSFFIGNLLRTNETGVMRAVLIDKTELSVGPHTELVINEYVYQPRTIGTFGMSLVTGTLRILSGNVSKAKDKDLQVQTPAASIGIRGTDFWIRQLGDSLDVVLIYGEVEITNEAGTVTLSNQGDYAFVAGPDAAPVKRTDLSRSEVFELLSSTTFDDELEALLNPDNNFRPDGEE